VVKVSKYLLFILLIVLLFYTDNLFIHQVVVEQ